MNSETKTCQNCKQEFTIEPEDFAFYERIKVPPPTFCPECRLMRRFIWRNENILYKRKCDATGKDIFSMFRHDSSVKVYEREYWWSDDWDPLEYGKDVDFNRPFLAQVKELIFQVPWPSRSVVQLTNSDYCMNCNELKDCYLVFHASHSEGCYYGVGVEDSKDCFDNLYVFKSELCYGSNSLVNCYQVFFSRDCNDSKDLYFSVDCNNCSNCFGCAGLRNKQYCIFNEQYSKEDYFKKLEELQVQSYDNIKKYLSLRDETAKKVPTKYARMLQNSDSTGEYIYNSKNVKKSYLIEGGEDCKYCQDCVSAPGIQDCYDYSMWGGNAELIYDTSQAGLNVSNVFFSVIAHSGAERVQYSFHSVSSRDIFGCVGLRNKQYCILNKQYSKEEYEALVQKIKKHMDDMPYTDRAGNIYKYGELVPPEFSPFAYNETVAQEFFPLSKSEATDKKHQWQEIDVKEQKPTINWNDMPESIHDVSDSIIKEVILCEAWDANTEKAAEHNCTKVFRITPKELEFYRRFQIPLPHKCFYSRHFDRIRYRNPIKFWTRGCTCAGQKSENSIYQNTVEHFHKDNHCPNEFETSYAPDRPEIVYCESCYQQEVV